MSKIPLIIQREYFTRIRNKTFIIMAIIGPILFAGVFVSPALLTQASLEENRVVIVDDTRIIHPALKDSKYIKYNHEYADMDLDAVFELFEDSAEVSLLYIPKNVINSSTVILYSPKPSGIYLQSGVEKAMQDVLFVAKLRAANVSDDHIERAKTRIRVLTDTYEGAGKAATTETKEKVLFRIGMGAMLLIYLFILMYGVQVMRGVIEEKSSRIVEVIISSVKPFQLMMGKIIGIGLVALTQFTLWVLLTGGFLVILYSIFIEPTLDPENVQNVIEGAEQLPGGMSPQQIETLRATFDAIYSINFPFYIGMFLFYFLGGYLLYASLFAAIGGAVDAEADTQQFMFPVTAPLVFAVLAAVAVHVNPDGPVAFWCTMIPFTSPVVVMARLPYEMPVWELITSMVILVGFFLFTTWAAARIYRAGILLYGKKVSYKELWKWLWYKG